MNEQTPPDATRKQPSDRTSFVLAVIMAGIAGWVDAVSFVHWHGLFVAFMSGNTTRGAADVGVDWSTVLNSVRAIPIFVGGVLLGETIGPSCGPWGRAVVLLVEAILLWLGLWASVAGQGEAVTASILGMAMGVQNASMHEADGISVALTYVTGTLVKIGRSLAKALRGAGPWSAALPYLGLWLGLFGGALAGAATARASEFDALVIAAAVVTGLSLYAGLAARRASVA